MTSSGNTKYPQNGQLRKITKLLAKMYQQGVTNLQNLEIWSSQFTCLSRTEVMTLQISRFCKLVTPYWHVLANNFDLNHLLTIKVFWWIKSGRCDLMETVVITKRCLIKEKFKPGFKPKSKILICPPSSYRASQSESLRQFLSKSSKPTP